MKYQVRWKSQWTNCLTRQQWVSLDNTSLRTFINNWQT